MLIAKSLGVEMTGGEAEPAAEQDFGELLSMIPERPAA